MTAAEYKAAGFRMSQQVSQDEITRAENDVTTAYIRKVAPEADMDDDTVKEAIMQLAFIAMTQRSTVATRAGGKVKIAPSLSDNAQATLPDYRNADRLLRSIQTEAGNASEIVDDILEIFYRNKFIAL